MIPILCLAISVVLLAIGFVWQGIRHGRDMAALNRKRCLDNQFTDKRVEDVANMVYELRGERVTSACLRAEKRHLRLVPGGKAS
jgi:hypothetical protein